MYERLIEEAMIANPTRLSYTRVSNDTEESMRINKAVADPDDPDRARQLKQ